MRIEALAPAKLVLIGEYAVLDGAPAIVAAVDRLVRVELSPAPMDAPRPWSIRSDLGGGQASSLTFDEQGALRPGDAWRRPVDMVLERAVRSSGMRPGDLPGGELVIESAALFVGAGETKLGLGSSAAVVTALSAALQDALVYWNLQDAAPASLSEALAAHRQVQQGAGSGVDVAASLAGGVLRYQLVDGRPEGRGLHLPPGIGFRAVWTGAPASTRHLVDGVRAWRATDPEPFAALMAEMSTLAHEAVEACESGSAADFLAAVSNYHAAMDRLGQQAGLPIVTEPHRTLAGVAAAAGVAYKPSGAGGGDVGLLFAASEPALVEAGRLAEQAGYRLLDLGIHPAGVTVERHERTAS